jgi:hypothetical protein
MCNGPLALLGELGDAVWVRCVCCGMTSMETRVDTGEETC